MQRNACFRDPFIIFAGGMPRASYGDRHTLSVMQGENHVVFDFTSRVVDFIVMSRADQCDATDDRTGKLQVFLSLENTYCELYMGGCP